MRRHFAEQGWSGTAESAAKTGFGPLTIVVVAAGVRATTQTAHLADSVLFEWWCATIATADQTVSSRHSEASAFLVEHISHTHRRQYT
jgi:hypothetical protein